MLKVGDIVTISQQGTRWCEIRNGDFYRDGLNPYGIEGEVLRIKAGGLPVHVRWSNGTLNAYKDYDLILISVDLENK